MVKRGEIYRDSLYTYPAGNTEDKFLVVLNKIHLTSQPIIVTPCTTNKKQTSYKLGCNHKVPVFYFKAKEDFFENDTIVQLFIIDKIEETPFNTKRGRKIIEYHATLNKENIQRLIACIVQIKEDIPQNLYQFLF